VSKKTSKDVKTKPAKALTGKPSTGPMDLGMLEQMIALMSQHDVSALDVRDGDKRVILKRGAQFVTAPAASHTASHAPAHSPAPAHTPAAAAPAAPKADDTAGLVAIKSPMVGTFYAKPSPDAKPFVTVGATVDEDTDVCIIEAMKVFNNIKAETRGTIAKILVTAGQSVEFGQPLFLVKPN
jgi:acetyl-CoA carboxylase biotin carboxyl carrier protein